MAGTILSYLREYGEKSLKELPFCEVDALIMCQLVYLKFDGLVPDVNVTTPPRPIKEISESPLVDDLFSDERYEKVNRELFELILGSRRFGNLHVGSYVNLIEKEWETQFSAVTFYLEGGMAFLAFRGTDETIVGWKEDCNMAFLNPIPSQHCALKYLNVMAGRVEGPLFMGGHSKGGNLAIFAAMNCSSEIRERIDKIYNMDGPGFRPEVLENSAYDMIEERIVKLLPHSSFIGMLFERDSHYRVVESKNIGVFQHDPYSWVVKGSRFVETKEVRRGQRFMDQAVNDWILTLSKEQLKSFVDTLFSLVYALGVEDLLELNEDKKTRILNMLSAMKELDDESKQGMKKVLGALFEIMGKQALKEIDEKWKHIQKH